MNNIGRFGSALFRPISPRVGANNGRISPPISRSLGRISPPISRSLGTISPPKVAVISGGSGELGRRQTVESVSSSVYDRVIVITTNPKQIEQSLGKRDLQRVAFVDRSGGCMQTSLANAIPEDAQELHFYNTVGGTPKGITPRQTAEQFREKNSGPTMDLLNDISTVAKEKGVRNFGVVHFSSITASMSDTERCLYARERAHTEEQIVEHLQGLEKEGMKVRSTMLRIGFVMQDIEDGVLDTGYDFGLHHISHLPFSMGFSHGMHPVQPVHMRDIATAAFNILHHPEYNNNGEVIDAVSEINTLPFMHFISALHPRFGDPSKSLLVILIPLEVAEAATKVFSTGHFQEYAVHFTRAQEERVKRGESDALCPQKFEQVLGREPIDVVGTLQKEKQEKDFVCAKPEYGKMVRGLFRNVRNHPSHAKNAAKGVLKGLSGIRVGRVEEKNNSTF